MNNPATIAYLTSVYPRASDSFIRGEITALRNLGHTVHTFAVRRPAQDQLVSAEIRREAEATGYLLSGGGLAGMFKLLLGYLLLLTFSPRRSIQALRLAGQCRWPGIKGHGWPIAYLAEAALLARQLKAKQITHLHNHIGENSAAVAMLASVLAGIPYSLTIHGPYEFDSPVKFALRLKIQQAKFVVAITHYTKAQLCRWVRPEDRTKIQIVHCAVQPEFLSAPLVALPASPAVVCVGRLCPEKGQWVLVEALALLKRQGVSLPLTFIGDGPSRPEIEAAIARHGLQNQITLAGWRSSAEVRTAIEQSTALVLPSFAEGLPVVIMEALALGRPVISTYIAGIPELVIDQQNGWLVPAGSVEKLAEVLGTLLKTPVDRLAAMGRAGTKQVQQQHDPRTEAAKLASLITA